MDAEATNLTPSTPWQQACLRRLHRLLELTPEAAPPDLSPLEALALLEWSRMATFADCHAAGAGHSARAMLRRSLSRQ